MRKITKAENSLIALACGDAYGSPYEHAGIYGGGTPSIEELPDTSYEDVTDDTSMAVILWKHYSLFGTIAEYQLMLDYINWARLDGHDDGIGTHTAEVLIHASDNKDSQGNGALMRVIPFGLRMIDDGISFDDAVEQMNIDSSLTHDNDTIKMANRLCLDMAINGVSVLYDNQYSSLLERLESGRTAWVIHSLYAISSTLVKELSILDGFKDIVSQGGDTDTNCAIYGAIVGYHGEQVDMGQYLSKESIDLVSDALDDKKN